GEAIDALGAVTGGSEPPLEETLLARARELRELAAATREAEATAEAEQRALDAIRARLADVGATLSQGAERVQALRLELLAGEKDREGLEAERARIAADLEVSALEASGLAGTDGQLAGELAALDESLTGASTMLGDRRAALGDAQAALAEWRRRPAGAGGRAAKGPARAA